MPLLGIAYLTIISKISFVKYYMEINLTFQEGGLPLLAFQNMIFCLQLNSR